MNREYGLARSADVVTQYNAGWRDYLATGGRMHYAWWSHQLFTKGERRCSRVSSR